MIEERSLNKSILLCQQGAFFVITESKSDPIGSRMGKALQGLHMQISCQIL